MDMTPMIDVVFLLIIFFMMVSQISEIKRAKLDLPKLWAETEQDVSKLTVNLDATGQIMINARPMSLLEMVALLQNELDETNTPASDLSVVLRADRSCDSTFVNQVVAELGRLGVLMIRIAVQDPN